MLIQSPRLYTCLCACHAETIQPKFVSAKPHNTQTNSTCRTLMKLYQCDSGREVEGRGSKSGGRGGPLTWHYSAAAVLAGPGCLLRGL